ncbi:class II aldolase/adducin family protein [Roseobacter sp.]|uniref:class II aldolase/adducin family protein n=1 Tax=Roseobacter sp. TaxID=1907202 RepID=UPI00385BFA43
MAPRKLMDPASQDFEDLKKLSAEFGQNALHIQGAGGNASIKDDDKMWIKASGTMLADALIGDVFVPVDLARMKVSVTTDQPDADTPAAFLIPGASELRPSIETSLHAVFSQRFVLHTHCIHTIAHAVQSNAEDLLTARLRDFKWAFVSYAKPGANLARSVLEVLTPDINVIVLGNHGLIVAGDSIDEVRDLQNAVHTALNLPETKLRGEDPEALMALVDDGSYSLPDDPMLHQIALSDHRVAQVTAGSLYPDHVIFCGIAVMALPPEETTQSIENKPICLLVPDAGLLLRKDASLGAKTMLRCLVDVIMRLPENAKLTYLTPEQNFELLNWDAEKYRQAFNVE